MKRLMRMSVYGKSASRSMCSPDFVERCALMRRYFNLRNISLSLMLSCASLQAQEAEGPTIQTLAVPSTQAKSIATALSMEFREFPQIQVAADAKGSQLVVMAPADSQAEIAAKVQEMLASNDEGGATQLKPLNRSLLHITSSELEQSLVRLSGDQNTITTSVRGQRAVYQFKNSPLRGTTVQVNRALNTITVMSPSMAISGWERLLSTIDQPKSDSGQTMELVRLVHAEPEPIQRALRLMGGLKKSDESSKQNDVFRQAAFQEGGQVEATIPLGNQEGLDGDFSISGDEGGAGVIGDTQIQFVPELGTIIIRGAKRDVQRVMDVIKEIEQQSEVTKPDIEVVDLEHADSNAVADLLEELYQDVLSARQGEVSITSLDAPNALLLIGRKEAIAGVMELVEKLDQPLDNEKLIRVFRLQNASAVDAEETVRGFFTDRPGTGEDLRPAIGPRVRVLADYRTNSLIVSAAPRDLDAVTTLVNELDVEHVAATNQIKIFPLNHAVAEDLAPVLQEAINGEGDGGNDNITAPSATLSIVAVDSKNQELIDSGVLSGAVVTADTGGNAIVVRAPATSMPLIGELIRQLDQAPGIESLVKVFTIENGDALQLTTALQTLFGDDSATQGTSVGAGNLPSSTASSESSLVPLRFTTDQRTNSIIVSGGANDLDVVESILLRLDGEGFAERITEVIWLRHQTAADVATAIQTYVQQRTQTVNTIQQFQQGLGPYDLADRDLIVVAEPISNSLLLSVSPRLYEGVRRMIDQLDRRPPMVLIKVMIAEVRLDDAFEVGGEFGLQDSLLYDRGIAASAVDQIAVASPNLNKPNQNVYTRGFSSLGLGTSSSSLGYGGFVLSAASDSVSLLLRTLQDSSRLQILSRPQIMTMDNTEGFVQVGRLIARVTDVINNGIQGSQLVTEDTEVGLIMNVRPRVGADGLIIMDVDATRSARDDLNGTTIPTGGNNGETVLINDILRTTAQSVVAAYSGQTVIFGGLIQKERFVASRRVPYVADIPLIGNLFKFDTESEVRSELIVFLTPMLVTGEEDLDYVKQVESSRMSWCLADVVEAHGDVGMSGGYGLWGPAVGTTIYPDLQPTVDDLRKRPSPEAQVFPGEGYPTPSAYPRTEQYQEYLEGERGRAPNVLDQDDQASSLMESNEQREPAISRPIVPVTIDSDLLGTAGSAQRAEQERRVVRLGQPGASFSGVIQPASAVVTPPTPNRQVSDPYSTIPVGNLQN